MATIEEADGLLRRRPTRALSRLLHPLLAQRVGHSDHVCAAVDVDRRIELGEARARTAPSGGGLRTIHKKPLWHSNKVLVEIRSGSRICHAPLGKGTNSVCRQEF